MSTGYAVFVAGDLHCNSTLGLCPPRVVLDDGGTYTPSKPQIWLWECWLDWLAWADELAGRRKRVAVLLGDLVDGNHHRTHQIITKNETTQHRIAVEVLSELQALKPRQTYVVRGTASHVGESAKHEEMLADAINAVPDKDTGSSSWWWLRLTVGGTRFDFRHHGKVGYRPWTKPNAANAVASQIVMDYADEPEKRPHVAVRAHRHKFIDSGLNYPVRVVQNYPWQLTTGYGHAIDAGAGVLPVGGLVFLVDGPGEYRMERRYYSPARPKQEVI